MEEPATQDLRGYRLLPIIFKAIGKPKSGQLKRALATLRTWHQHGAHRRDLNRDGVDEETPAIEIMDAWWPKLVTAEFKPALGAKAFERLQGMLSDRRPHRRLAAARRTSTTAGGATSPRTCAASSAPKPRGAFSRKYCGSGSKKKCRQLLQKTLKQALKVSPRKLYGGGNGKCAADPQPACFDQNRPQVTGGIELGPFPFQNRPTFQQTVTLTQRLPR